MPNQDLSGGITLAAPNDITDIMRLLAECIKDMNKNGIRQWSDFYPTIDVITEDVRNKSMYCVRHESQCIGIITLSEKQNAQYEQVRWLTNFGRVLIVYRLAVHPKWQRQGIARRLMDFAEQFAVENQYNSIRLDAYSGNPRAVRFYERRGYEEAGQVYFPKRNMPFHCFEKSLEQ